MFKIILLAIPVLLAVFAIIVALQPSSYVVTRSLAMNVPPASIFPFMNDLKKWELWNPWSKADPNIRLTYSNPPTGTGATYSWAGNNEVGEGRVTIAESHPPVSVKYQLEFFKPFAGTAQTEFTFQPLGNITQVTCTMTGEKSFPAKAFCLFVSMDKMVGDKFAKALIDLKAIVESLAK